MTFIRRALLLLLLPIVVLALRAPLLYEYALVNIGLLQVNQHGVLADATAARLRETVTRRGSGGAVGLWLDLQAADTSPAAAPLTAPAEMRAWGRQRQVQGDSAGALERFAAARVAGDLTSDNWYATGTALVETGRYDEADAAFTTALEHGRSPALGQADIYLARGILRYENLQDPVAAGADFAQAIDLDDFATAHSAATAFYRLGELALWNQQNPVLARYYYQQAATRQPDNHWAHLRLGYARYWGARDLSGAEAAIYHALALWPDEKYREWPFFYLGEIYADAGLASRAIQAYEAALNLAPEDPRLQARIAALRSD